VDDFVTVIHCAMNGKQLSASKRGKVVQGKKRKAAGGEGGAKSTEGAGNSA
jgi:hypothetical protein